MSLLPDRELGENWARFLAHWIAASFGFALDIVMPLFTGWPALPPDHSFPRWWWVFGMAAGWSLVVGAINANLPVTARELLKSTAIGFAICAIGRMLKLV